MPGLINCHTHLPMSVLRGYADDVELSSWLNDYIFPHEDRLDGRSAKAGSPAVHCRVRPLRHDIHLGHMYNFCDEIAEAVAESGHQGQHRPRRDRCSARTSTLKRTPPAASLSP